MRYAGHVEYMTNIIDATLCWAADTERRGPVANTPHFLNSSTVYISVSQIRYAYHRWYAKEFHGVRGREGITRNGSLVSIKQRN